MNYYYRIFPLINIVDSTEKLYYFQKVYSCSDIKILSRERVIHSLHFLQSKHESSKQSNEWNKRHLTLSSQLKAHLRLITSCRSSTSSRCSLSASSSLESTLLLCLRLLCLRPDNPRSRCLEVDLLLLPPLSCCRSKLLALASEEKLAEEQQLVSRPPPPVVVVVVVWRSITSWSDTMSVSFSYR